MGRAGKTCFIMFDSTNWTSCQPRAFQPCARYTSWTWLHGPQVNFSRVYSVCDKAEFNPGHANNKTLKKSGSWTSALGSQRHVLLRPNNPVCYMYEQYVWIVLTCVNPCVLATGVWISRVSCVDFSCCTAGHHPLCRSEARAQGCCRHDASTSSPISCDRLRPPAWFNVSLM